MAGSPVAGTTQASFQSHRNRHLHQRQGGGYERERDEGNTLTVGNYTAVYSMGHAEYDGLNQLLQAKNNPNPIVVNLSDGTNNYALTDSQGLFWNANPQSWMAFNESWHATTTAFFVADEWNIGKWR